jgi:lipopolysaccharide transport system permease protein
MSAGPAKSAAEPEWRIIRTSSRWLPRLRLKDLWAHRELGLMLALRDLQLRYRQTLFGVGWAVLQPLLAMALFTVVFGRLTDVPSDGIPYSLFVLAGLAVWSFISTAVGSAADSLVENQELVTRVRFPRMLAPVAAVLAASVDLLIGLLLLIPLMVGFDVAPSIAILTLPLWIVGALLVATAAGLWLSAANVLYRDVRYAMAFLLQIWLFASPVVYPSSLFSGVESYLYALNPAAGVIDGFRWAILDGPAPGPELAVSAASLLVLLVSGALYFAATERKFADRI